MSFRSVVVIARSAYTGRTRFIIHTFRRPCINNQWVHSPSVAEAEGTLPDGFQMPFSAAFGDCVSRPYGIFIVLLRVRKRDLHTVYMYNFDEFVYIFYNFWQNHSDISFYYKNTKLINIAYVIMTAFDVIRYARLSIRLHFTQHVLNAWTEEMWIVML